MRARIRRLMASRQEEDADVHSEKTQVDPEKTLIDPKGDTKLQSLPPAETPVPAPKPALNAPSAPPQPAEPR